MYNSYLSSKLLYKHYIIAVKDPESRTNGSEKLTRSVKHISIRFDLGKRITEVKLQLFTIIN